MGKIKSYLRWRPESFWPWGKRFPRLWPVPSPQQGTGMDWPHKHIVRWLGRLWPTLRVRPL